MAQPEYQRFARRLLKIEQNLSGLSTPQLIHSSIEDGSIDEYDEAGSLVGVIGKQFDGTHGAVAFQGPVPPAPSAPGAVGGPGTLSVSWDGLFADGAARPLDLHFVRATAVPVEGEPFSVGTLVASGSIVATVPAGVYEVSLVAESMPGLQSARSLSASATVTVPADQQALMQEIADANTRLDEARAELETEIGTAPVGLGRLEDGVIPDAVVAKLFSDVVVARTKVVSEAFIGGSAIITGAITAPKITASQELWAKIGQFASITSGMITTGALDGKLITGAIIRTAPTGARVQIDQNGLYAYDAAGAETVRLNGSDNQITGRLTTNAPGQPGIILIPTTTSGKPGIWLSSTGAAAGTEAAIYADSGWNLVLRGKTDGSGFQGAVQIQGGFQVTSGGVGHANTSWSIGDTGTGFFKQVRSDSGVIGRGVFSDKHVEVVQNLAGLYFRTAGGTAPAGSDGAIYVPDTQGPVEVRGPIDSAGVRQGLRVIGGRLDIYDPPTGTFSANVGMTTTPKDRIYKLTSNAKYKVAIEPMALDRAMRLLDVAPVTWFDRGQAEAYADHMAGDGPELDDIMPLRRIPGVTAQDVSAAGLEEFVTYDAHGELEGVTYDRFFAPLLLLVKNLYAELAQLKGNN